jgi:hypothetical protein
MKMLKGLVGTFKINVLDKRVGYKNSKIRLKGNTLSSTYLKHVDDDFYVKFDGGRRKVVRENVLNRLSPLSIAAWFMDDGCSHKNKDSILSVRLSTHGFTKEENEVIVKWFKEKYDIEFNIDFHKRTNTYSLRCNKSNSDKFISLVKPYIIPSMVYKISPFHYNTGHSISSEDIVRTVQECTELVRNNKPLPSRELDESDKKRFVEYLTGKKFYSINIQHWRRNTPSLFIRFSDSSKSIFNELKTYFGGTVSKQRNRFRYQLTDGKFQNMFKTLGIVTKQ